MPVPSRRAEDLYASWWQLVSALGAVPRVLVWDGEGAVGRRRARHSELTAECQAFRGTLAAKVLGAAGRPTQRPRGWWSGCTTTWSGHCLAELQLVADFNTQLHTSWTEPTPVTTAGWDADRPIESTPTGQR